MIKKNAAYETLLSKYKEMFPLASKDDVKKKINSLRNNYRKELKKYLQSMKSGFSTDDIYQPTLWYYNEMSFLQDQESSSDSQSSIRTTRLNYLWTSLECEAPPRSPFTTSRSPRRVSTVSSLVTDTCLDVFVLSLLYF